jgi:hypothetical protein
MQKTGKLNSQNYGFIWLFKLLVLCCFPIVGWAQGVNVQATVSENQVFSGEYVELKVSVSGERFKRLSKPEFPTEIEGFRLVSQNPSTSRSIQIINGQTSSSYTYGYYLIAEKSGTFQIPAINIDVDGKIYSTEPLSVTIVDRNTAASANNTNGNETATVSGDDKPDIYLQMEVNDKSPVVGQQLVIGLVLYFKSSVDIQSYSPIPGWKAEGFWKEELNNPSRPTTSSEIIDGIKYRKAQLLQYALFPTKSGELVISPFEIGVSVRSTSNRRDPFSSVFGGFGTNQRNVNLKSNSIKLNVRDYQIPDGVIDVGAVGSFTVSRELSMRDLVEGETIEIMTQYAGQGNVPLLFRPEYELPEAVEVYEPQEKATVNRNNGNISGRKLFTELVVARNAGEYEIPAVKLGYYDPSANRYKVTELPALSFTVKPDARRATINSQGNVGRLAVQPILGLTTWQVTGQEGVLSGLVYFLILMPTMLLIVGFFYKRYLQRIGSDTAFARLQNADKKVKEVLTKAKDFGEQGQIKEAYSAIHKALSVYIADCTNKPVAGLSDKEYVDLAISFGLEKEKAKSLEQLLVKCSTIRFAPNTSIEDLNADIELADNMVKELKSAIKA